MVSMYNVWHSLVEKIGEKWYMERIHEPFHMTFCYWLNKTVYPLMGKTTKQIKRNTFIKR